MKQTNKQTNIELLRIVCALMVIAVHMISQSDVLDNCSPSNYVFSVIFHAGGRLACSVFVIIGAYFLVDIPFRTYRVAHLFFKTIITVAVIDFAIIIFCRNLVESNGNIIDLVIQIFPIVGKPYWFIDSYIYMLILSPILNHLLNESKIQNYVDFLLAGSVILIVLGSHPASFQLFPFANDTLWFCFLYLLTGRLKHQKIFTSVSFGTWATVFILCYISMCGICIVCNQLKNSWEYAWILRFFYISTFQSIFAFAAAISLFGLFLHIDISNKRMCSIVEIISRHTFGIFLIHQVPLLWQNGLLWNEVFQIKSYAYNTYFPARCFISLIICFFGCFIVDVLLDKLYVFFSHVIRLSQLSDRIDKCMGATSK